MLALHIASGVFCGLLILLTVVWACFYLAHRTIIKVAARLPAPLGLPTLPVVGHAHYVLLGNEGLVSALSSAILKAIQNGFQTFVIWIGPRPTILVSGLDDVKKILTSSSTLDKSSEYHCIDLAFNGGLVTASGSVWKKTSRYLHPMFHARNLEKLIPTFNKNSRELVSILSEHVNAGPVNVFHHTMDTALQSTCNLIYGWDIHIDVKAREFRALIKTLERYPVLMMERVYKIWLVNDKVFEYLYSKEIKEMFDGFAGVSKIYRQGKDLNQMRCEEDSNKSTQSEEPLSENKKENNEPDNFFHFYRNLQERFPQFNDETLRNEVNTLFFAGTDTLAAAVSSCLLLLAYHPQVQEKVFQEISSVMVDREEVAIEDIKKLQYLDQVFKETLRWSNIVPLVGRKPSTDLQLSTFTIPTGCTIGLNLLQIHMDPKVYATPEKFDPERFSPTNAQKISKYSFLPFSGGPRGCIGKFYAEILLKIQVIHVIRRFKITTDMDIHKLNRKYGVTLVCSDGYNIELFERT